MRSINRCQVSQQFGLIRAAEVSTRNCEIGQHTNIFPGHCTSPAPLQLMCIHHFLPETRGAHIRPSRLVEGAERFLGDGVALGSERGHSARGARGDFVVITGLVHDAVVPLVRVSGAAHGAAAHRHSRGSGGDVPITELVEKRKVKKLHELARKRLGAIKSRIFSHSIVIHNFVQWVRNIDRLW